MLKTAPAVFAVGKNYQIMVPVDKKSLLWVEIGDKRFDDEKNGVMCSQSLMHSVTVPMEILDEAGEYTVCERRIINRLPYFPLTDDTQKTVFRFSPLPNGNIRLYHLADAHNKVKNPVAAARAFGKIDLLVLGGDIISHSGRVANFNAIYRIAGELTGGNIPIVFARGNHDLRGYYAEKIADYIPNDCGNTYYTFRLGSVWGIVLDCGEDKDDSHAEYGLTVSCHRFRERQTEFIKRVAANAESEYNAPGVVHRLVICHNPFTHRLEPPFNIEPEIYSQWASLLKENIKPELMLCGHLHRLIVSPVGGEMDNLGQPCTVLIASDIKKNFAAGGGVELNADGSYSAWFCSSDGTKTACLP